MMTGVLSDRSSTSVWNVASVTSMTVTAPPAEVDSAGGPAGPAGAVSVGRLGAARSALRSIAPRMIAGVLRGSMVVKFCTSTPAAAGHAAPVPGKHPEYGSGDVGGLGR